MKNLIILVILILVAWCAITMFGGKASISTKSGNKTDGAWQNSYEIMTENNSYEDIVGTHLPESTSNINAQVYFYSETGDKCSWLVASLPEEDFYLLCEELNLIDIDDLLIYWPEAFDCDLEEFSDFWNLTKAVDEYTLLNEETEEETKRLLKYENGNIYIKKVTKYIVNTDDYGALIYRKKLK